MFRDNIADNHNIKLIILKNNRKILKMLQIVRFTILLMIVIIIIILINDMNFRIISAFFIYNFISPNVACLKFLQKSI